MRVSMSLCVFLMTLTTTFGQVTYEVMEFTGKVLSIEPGFRFAYEVMLLQTDKDTEHFLFYPHYGEFFAKDLHEGDKISVRVKVNVKMREYFKSLKDEDKRRLLIMQRNYITEIKIKNEWIVFTEKTIPETQVRENEHRAFLDKTVKDVYILNGFTRALILDNGLIAYTSWVLPNRYPLKEIRVGDVVSFSGIKFSNIPGYVYPVEGVKEVYHYSKLIKQSGVLKSYLYKQNYVCIGAKFLTKEGEVSVSFPSDKAREISAFLKSGRDVFFYSSNYSIENHLPGPELHAIIQDKDTLYVDRHGFYGGADVKHEHKQVTVSGKIKEVVRSDRGRIISLLINNDVYIEMDPRFEKQIGALLKRGASIEVGGDERIKKEGEIYSKDYRIITPNQITIAGKVYLLNQLPY